MMRPFLENLERLFGWLVQASWQASVLVALVLFIQWAFRTRLNSRWTHALWLLVIARLLLPVLPESAISLFQFAPAPPPIIVQSVTEPIFAPLIPEFSDERSAPAPIIAPPYPFSVCTLLALVWLVGAMGLLALTWRVNRRFGRHVRNAPPIDDPVLLQIASSAQTELGLHRSLRLIESAHVQGPAIMGLVHPTLILPQNVRAKFTDAELRFIFLHEFAHLKRGDLVLQWLVAILQILHWFNPVLWYAFRRMRADREPATDALVLSRTGNAEQYGQVLIKLLEHYHQRHALPTLVGILEDKDQFKRRFTLIGQFTRGAYGWSLLGVACLGALAAVGLTRGAGKRPDQPVITDSQAKQEGIAVIVDGHPIKAIEVEQQSAATEQSLKNGPYGPAPAAQIDKLRQNVLRALIDRRLILEDFKNSGGELPKGYIDDRVNDEIKDRYSGRRDVFLQTLSQRNETLDQFREEIADNAIVSLMRTKNLTLKLRRYYRDHLDLFPADEQINVTVVTIPYHNDQPGDRERQRQVAEQALDRIRKGADALKVAKGFPDLFDFGHSGWITKDGEGSPPSVWPALEKLQLSQLSDVIEGPWFFVVGQMNQRRPAKMPATDQTERSKELIMDTEEDRLKKDWLGSLRVKASIQYFPPYHNLDSDAANTGQTTSPSTSTTTVLISPDHFATDAAAIHQSATSGTPAQSGPLADPAPMTEAEAASKGIAALVNGRPIYWWRVTYDQIDPATNLRAKYSGDELKRMVLVSWEGRLQWRIDYELMVQEAEAEGRQVPQSAVADKIAFGVKGFGGDKQKFVDNLKINGLTLEQFEKITRDDLAFAYLDQVELYEPAVKYAKSHVKSSPESPGYEAENQALFQAENLRLTNELYARLESHAIIHRFAVPQELVASASTTPLLVIPSPDKVQPIIDAVKKDDAAALKRAIGNSYVSKVVDQYDEPLLFDVRSPAVAEILLQHGADANERNSSGDPALVHLCRNGGPNSAAIARALIDHGADVNARSTEGGTGETPLLDAKDGATVDLLIAHGADPKAKWANGANIFTGAGIADVSMFEALLRHGIPFDLKSDGPTVLLHASWVGNTALMEDLLKRGVDPNAKGIFGYDHGGKPVLMLPLVATTTAGGKTQAAELLLDHGAKGDAVMLNSIYNRLKDGVKLLWERGVRSISPLKYAVSQDVPVDDLRKMLDQGSAADPAQDKTLTPLGTAALDGNLDAVMLLISRGADVNKGEGPPDPKYPFKSMTPLIAAAWEGQDAIVAYLLAHGARPDPGALWQAAENSTPYHTQFEQQLSHDHFEKTVRILLDAGALKNTSAEQQGFIISAAIQTRQGPPNLAVLKMLLDAGTDPNAPMPYIIENGEKPNSVIGYFRDRYAKFAGTSPPSLLAAELKPALDLMEAKVGNKSTNTTLNGPAPGAPADMPPAQQKFPWPVPGTINPIGFPLADFGEVSRPTNPTINDTLERMIIHQLDVTNMPLQDFMGTIAKQLKKEYPDQPLWSTELMSADAPYLVTFHLQRPTSVREILQQISGPYPLRFSFRGQPNDFIV